jgi:hypothetical protein
MTSINVPVINSLCSYIANDIQSSKINKFLLNNYELILNEIKSLNPLINHRCSNLIKTSKPKTKKEEIMLSVAKKSIDLDIKWLVLQYNSNDEIPAFRNWKFNESIVVSMLLWAIKCINHNNKPSYNCIMSFASCINDLDLNDSLIIQVYEQLSAKLNINEIFKDYSELIVHNFYTQRYKSNEIKPYPAQKHVMDIYKQALEQNKPCCISYSTETGSGKTYLSLALARAHRAFTKPNELSINVFIFVCYNITVRKMVLSMCDNLNIPACMIETNGVSYRKDIGPVFNLNRCAINIKSKNAAGNERSRKNNSGQNIIKAEWAKFDEFMKTGSNEEKIRNQFVYLNNIKDHEQSFNAALPQIYICDPECATHLIKIAPNSTVFVDEPDVDDDQHAEQYVKILSLFPKRCIIVSATLGNINEYSKKFQSYYGNDSITQTVNYGTSGIHSTIVIGNRIYLPHYEFNLNNPDEKNRFLSALSSTSIIKMYSPFAIAMMLENYINLDEHFSFRSLNYDNIRTFIIDLFSNMQLEQLNKPLKYDAIYYPFTTDDYLRSGQTLSISNNPFNKANEWENGLFEINNYNINDARKKYIDDLRIYQGLLRQIKDNASSKNSRLAVEHKIADHARNEPTMYFPAESIIGTASHMKRYWNNSSSHNRSKIFTPSDDMFSSIDSELIKWLYAGVGIYDQDLCKPYINAVLKAAENEELAYLLSSPELIRGMDYRFDTVIIDGSFSQNASLSAIQQTIGRVGRPGSSKGVVHFCDAKYQPRFCAFDDKHAFATKLETITAPIKLRERKISKFSLNNKISAVELKVNKTPDSIIDPDSWEDFNTLKPIVKPVKPVIKKNTKPTKTVEEPKTNDAW